MAIDMFDTRYMLKVFEQMKKPNTFFKDTFFKNAVTFDTKVVDIDVVKGKRRMAPFVGMTVGGKTVDRPGYTTSTYEAPLVAPDMITTAEDIFHRAAGENIYAPVSPTERAAAQLGRDLVELDDIITRREEWMCAQALLTGSITIKGDGVDTSISYGLPSTHNVTLTSGDLWSAGTSDPLAKLRTWARLIRQDAGVNPDTIVFASDVAEAFLAHDKVKGLLDKTKISLGQIDPRQLPGGVTYWGYLTDIGCDVYTYDEWYVDDDGNEQPMMPAKKVFMGSSKARTNLCYGAVADPVRGTFAMPRVPKSWVSEKPSARFVQVSSRPLPVPVQIDAFLVAKVLS